jgi:hypothetical protein
MITEDEKIRYVKLCLKKHEIYGQMNEGIEESVRTDFHRQLQDIDNQIRRMFSYLCGIPDKFREVVMWMVDVQATSSSDLDAAGLAAMTNVEGEEPEDVIRSVVSQIGGDLYKHVVNTLDRNGFKISDRGAGLSGWHVGVWCTSEDADRMIVLMRSEYKEELENYSIALRRMPWSFGFKGLHFQDEILAYAREHGIN